MDGPKDGPKDGPMDADLADLLEAHVRYELDRWRADALRDTVAEEVSACFGRLAEVSLSDLVPIERVHAWARRVVVEEPLADGLFEEIEWAVRAAQESVREETVRLDGVLPPERYDQLVSSVVGLRRLREEVVDQVTGSAVYAELITHVLYHGLKGYLLTENAVVRRVPGASSLVRMGQHAVRSAAPNLEAGIDRRLVAFVASNVAETVRDSREFLNATLDDAMLRTIADEVWAANRSRTVGEVGALVEEEPLGDLVAAGRDVWLSARSSTVVGQLIDAVVDQFYQAHGDEPVDVVLGQLGITAHRAGTALGAVAAQVMAVARDGGHLEAYLRRRLEAFYAGYSAARHS
jgi:hypothetical protein